MTRWCHPQFWGIRISNSGAYNFNLMQHTQIMWTFWSEHCCDNKNVRKLQSSCGRQHRQQPPSSATANDSFHGTSVSLARQAENEGEMRMLSESVDTSTRNYGVPACGLHTRSSSALPAIRTVYASVARALQSSHLEEMESYDREKGGLEDYILCWNLNPSQVESTSHWKSQSSILVWCHSCLKMPTQLPHSAVSWIWSRKLWNVWIVIRLLCWRWTSRSPQ